MFFHVSVDIQVIFHRPEMYSLTTTAKSYEVNF